MRVLTVPRLVLAGVPLALVAGLLVLPPLFSTQPQPPSNDVQEKDAGKAPADGPKEAGKPEAFTSKEGKKGWKVVIQGNRPLATPAVIDGKVLVGGGFGSHEFYALDAKSGKTLWVYRTGDDGPTAAAVADGYIAFNTESCELEILTMDGQRVWKKWLGDPLMSMPALADGKVYMAYPNTKPAQNQNAPAEQIKGRPSHLLACFDVKTGKELWQQPIPGDLITAPVLDGKNVYVATIDGTLSCLAQNDGKVAWTEKKNVTSSPAICFGKCYVSQREVVVAQAKDGEKVQQQTEQIASAPVTATALPANSPAAPAGALQPLSETKREADYLDQTKRQNSSALEKANKDNDAGVGFSSAPQAANLADARNIGQATVAGVWSYQGSRPFASGERLYTSMGDIVKCVDLKTDKVLWRKHLAKDDKQQVDAALTPPAIVNGKIFVGTVQGQVICLNAKTGDELWRATVGEPILFQPAVAQGRVYVSTNAGSVFCLETGDERDHGWLQWGGTARHNGLPE